MSGLRNRVCCRHLRLSAFQSGKKVTADSRLRIFAKLLKSVIAAQ